MAEMEEMEVKVEVKVEVKMEDIYGTASLRLTTSEMDLDLAASKTGGYMALVYFHLNHNHNQELSLTASPYSFSPGKSDEMEAVAHLLPLLNHVRGVVFVCLPFGGQEEGTGPRHGDVANGEWTLVQQTETCLTH